MLNNAYRQIVEGKSIALIGGAANANEERADQADIVIRCNLHADSCLHMRCDGRYIGGAVPNLPSSSGRFFWLDYRVLLSLEVWQLYATKIFTFENQQYEGVSPRGEAFEWLNAFNKQLGSVPLTGILAAHHLTQYPIRSLFVTGFDFWIEELETLRRRRADGKAVFRKHNHDLGSQLSWLLGLAAGDCRVSLDPEIYKVAWLGAKVGLV